MCICMYIHVYAYAYAYAYAHTYIYIYIDLLYLLEIHMILRREVSTSKMLVLHAKFGSRAFQVNKFWIIGLSIFQRWQLRTSVQLETRTMILCLHVREVWHLSLQNPVFLLVFLEPIESGGRGIRWRQRRQQWLAIWTSQKSPNMWQDTTISHGNPHVGWSNLTASHHHCQYMVKPLHLFIIGWWFNLAICFFWLLKLYLFIIVGKTQTFWLCLQISNPICWWHLTVKPRFLRVFDDLTLRFDYAWWLNQFVDYSC